MALPGLTIAQAAKTAGVTRKPVRVCEARSLLPATERTTAGYRLFDESDIELLTFSRRARAVGLHTDGIRDVLAVHNGGIPPCATVRDLLDDRIAELDANVAELLTLYKALADTWRRADHCADHSPSPSARSSKIRSSRASRSPHCSLGPYLGRTR
ncbi:MerR family transcriptional regulator [Streptomyces longwoodensis]|uniref:MerR family transcriptional regulator n=1 Tax=Streptomyces longwoodensis TaxID=68231 RepID=UPI0033EFF953